MNAATRAKLLKVLSDAIEAILLESDQVDPSADLPLLGDSAITHMAQAALNVVEAIEDSQTYIADQLDDETRERIGV